MKGIEQNGYRYLGILEVGEVLEEEMRSKSKTKYFRRLRLIIKSKLN